MAPNGSRPLKRRTGPPGAFLLSIHALEGLPSNGRLQVVVLGFRLPWPGRPKPGEPMPSTQIHSCREPCAHHRGHTRQPASLQLRWGSTPALTAAPWSACQLASRAPLMLKCPRLTSCAVIVFLSGWLSPGLY